MLFHAVLHRATHNIIYIINKILVYLNFQEMARFTSNGNIRVIQMLRGRQKHEQKEFVLLTYIFAKDIY